MDEALKFCHPADASEPYEAKVELQIAMILAKQGKLQEAREFFAKAFSIEPLQPGVFQAQIGLLREIGESR